MPGLELHTENGIEVVPESFLFVGIDETGHEDLPSPDHPAFGLGGCAVRADQYEMLVQQPWWLLKDEYFEGKGSALHANELRNPSPEQLSGLNYFFRSHGFGRIAAIVSERTERDDDLSPYQLAANLVLDRIGRLAQRFGCDGVVMVIEASDRANHLAPKYFEGYHWERRLGDSTSRLPCRKFFMSKSPLAPILEVSDFIIHTAGAQVRSVDRGIAWGARRDFETVFRSVHPSLSEFIYLAEAHGSGAAEV